MSLLIQQLRVAHKDLRLAGKTQNAILHLPEKQLLYLLSVLRNEQPILPQISIEEWQEFLSALAPHAIQSFFYWQIKSLPQALQPPGEICDQLRRLYFTSLARSLRLERQVAEIQQAFLAKDVQVLVLKGPALGRLVYPNPALRPSCDLDLLVKPRQFRLAREILIYSGYNICEQNFENFADFQIEERFVPDEQNNCPVELHWDIHNLKTIQKHNGMEELFSRAIRVADFEMLHPVDALIHAAIHNTMVHNQDMTLRWILDFTFLAQYMSDPQDWLVLQQRSVDWRARLAVEHSLKMAQLWFGAKLPQEFSDFLTWPKPTTLEKQAWSDTINRYESIFSMLRVRGVSSLKTLLRFAFPPSKIMRGEFSCIHFWQLPQAYVRRWLRWLARRRRGRLL
ncbi:MAG: nucleotidyltransferase family protein [bacterium]